MKKQKIKLGLSKSSVSNLSNLHAIKGGDPSYSAKQFCIASFTVLVDICCNDGGGGGGTTGGALCGVTLGLNCGFDTIIGGPCGTRTQAGNGC